MFLVIATCCFNKTPVQNQICNITKCMVVIPINTNARFASVFLLSRLAAGLGEFPSDTAALQKMNYIDVNHDNLHEYFENQV